MCVYKSAAESRVTNAAFRAILLAAQRRVDEVTNRGYLQPAQTQVLPYFDENALRLSECTAEVLQDYFDEKFKSGRLFGKGNRRNDYVFKWPNGSPLSQGI